MSKTSIKSEKTTKNAFVPSLLIIILTAVLIWLFTLIWFSGKNFAGEFASDEILSTFAMFGVIIFLLGSMYGFVHFFTKDESRLKIVALMNVVILLMTIICVICADKLNVFAMPISLCAVLLCVLVNLKVALAGNIMLSELLLMIFMIETPFSSYTMGNVAAAIFCNTMSGFVLLYLLSKNYTRIRFISVGLASGFAMAPFAAIVSLAMKTDILTVLSNAAWVLVANCISIVLYLPFIPIFETMFNVVTDYKLSELCNFSQPLLRRLAAEAPGTFNHSLIVGTLAENCALAIGEDTLLARAAAYYHDVGKLRSPEFFVENQKDGYNPHDDLIPEVSVSMITKHTKNGAQLLRENHMPDEIVKIANEHHGTSPVNYFYYKAQKITEGELDDVDYRYDGPKPTSKISAIIMICDSVEAAARAVRPEDDEAVEKLVDGLIKEKLDLGQFDDSEITNKDLALIKQTILSILPGIFHARIEYKK